MEFLRFIKGYLQRQSPYLLVETLSPLSPSPYQGEGEEILLRGAKPLLHTLLLK